MLPKWMLLTVGAIGVATLSMWIYNHSGPLGIMDNTVAATKDFVIDHIKDPVRLPINLHVLARQFVLLWFCYYSLKVLFLYRITI